MDRDLGLQMPLERRAWSRGSAPVAVVMIALNEAHNMRQVLENLAGWAQEVYVVDSYSSDDTVDICLEYGVQVVQRAFRNFGDQWNFAVHDLPVVARWTMKLDPDERLTDRLKREIEAAIARDDADGLVVHRRLCFMDCVLPVRQSILRLWRTGECHFTDVTVNEHPIVRGSLRQIAGDLEHRDSPDLHHWLEKQNQYTTAEALAAFHGAKLAACPKLFGTALERRMWIKKNYMRVPFRYLAMFCYHYVILGSWKAGWVGFAWARLRCDVYRLLEFKLREMRRTGRAPLDHRQGSGEPDMRVPQF